MDCARTVASLIVTAVATFALLFGKPVYAAEKGKPSRAATSVSRKKTDRTRAQAKRTSKGRQAVRSRPAARWVNGWQVGWSSWHEANGVERLTDHSEFETASSFQTIVIGNEWTLLRRRRNGLTIDLQLFLGRGTTESRDARLDFLERDELVWGGAGSIGWRWFFSQASGSQASVMAGAMYRHVGFSEPENFSFSKAAQRLLYYGKFEVAFSLTRRTSLFQQFTVPMEFPQRTGNMWVMGLKVR